jgi:hypothetical protein
MQKVVAILGILAGVLTTFAEEGQKANAAVAPSTAPAVLEKTESAALETFACALADAFLKNDESAFQALIVPAEVLSKILSPEFLKGTPVDLHRLLVEGNLQRFREFRGHFQDLKGFEYRLDDLGYRETNAALYSEPRRALHNTYITVAYAHRLILKIRVEDVVLVDGKCYLFKLD